MFTTPLRSENTPPSEPNTSGVEKTNIDAIRDAVKTLFRFAVLERVARTPSPIPIRPAATAPQPSLPRPRVTVQTPSIAAAMPDRTVQTTDRAATGGMASKHAKTPSTMPAMPELFGSRIRAHTGPSSRCDQAIKPAPSPPAHGPA